MSLNSSYNQHKYESKNDSDYDSDYNSDYNSDSDSDYENKNINRRIVDYKKRKDDINTERDRLIKDTERDIKSLDDKIQILMNKKKDFENILKDLYFERSSCQSVNVEDSKNLSLLNNKNISKKNLWIKEDTENIQTVWLKNKDGKSYTSKFTKESFDYHVENKFKLKLRDSWIPFNLCIYMFGISKNKKICCTKDTCQFLHPSKCNCNNTKECPYYHENETFKSWIDKSNERYHLYSREKI